MQNTNGRELPARNHAEAAALFRRPFAPGAIGFRAMTKVPHNGDPFGGAQVAAYIGAQSVYRQHAADADAIPALIDTLPAARDALSDPESRLPVREQLSSVLRAMPSLTTRERRVLAGTIDGLSYERVAPTVGATPKAASNVAYRARRKLAAALPRAA